MQIKENGKPVPANSESRPRFPDHRPTDALFVGPDRHPQEYRCQHVSNTTCEGQ